MKRREFLKAMSVPLLVGKVTHTEEVEVTDPVAKDTLVKSAGAPEHFIEFSAHPENTGNIYIGGPDGLMLAPGEHFESFSTTINMGEFPVSGDTMGDRVFVTSMPGGKCRKETLTIV